MRTKYKQRDIVVVDIFKEKRYVQQLATQLGIFERNEILSFTKSIFDILLVNIEDYTLALWEYLEEAVGDRLNNYDLTAIEIIVDVIIECAYETFRNATGLDTSYKVLDIKTDFGIFQVSNEEPICLH